MRKIEENNLTFCLSIYEQFFVDKDFSFNIRNTLFYGMAVTFYHGASCFVMCLYADIFPRTFLGKKGFYLHQKFTLRSFLYSIMQNRGTQQTSILRYKCKIICVINELYTPQIITLL